MPRVALLLGVCRFSGNLPRLRAPAHDVEALDAALRDPMIGGYDEVIRLVDPTEAKLRRAIATLFDKRRREDLLVLYYSGHGLLDSRGDLYLAATDTDTNCLSATAISSRYVSEQMDRSRSKRQVVILDCCYSGAFQNGSKGGFVPAATLADGFKGHGFGRTILTASDATEFAWDSDRVLRSECSVFTHFLSEGLHGAADLDGDGRISVDELYEYTYDKVLELGCEQTPGKWSFGQQGDLLIAARGSALPGVTSTATTATSTTPPAVSPARVHRRTLKWASMLAERGSQLWNAFLIVCGVASFVVPMYQQFARDDSPPPTQPEARKPEITSKAPPPPEPEPPKFQALYECSCNTVAESRKLSYGLYAALTNSVSSFDSSGFHRTFDASWAIQGAEGEPLALPTLEDGAPLAHIETPTIGIGLACAGHLVVIASEYRISGWDMRTRSRVWTTQLPSRYPAGPPPEERKGVDILCRHHKIQAGLLTLRTQDTGVVRIQTSDGHLLSNTLDAPEKRVRAKL